MITTELNLTNIHEKSLALFLLLCNFVFSYTGFAQAPPFSIQREFDFILMLSISSSVKFAIAEKIGKKRWQRKHIHFKNV